jgi:hypothetical protein
MNHLDIFEIPSAPGLKFRVHIEQDDTNDAPWEREDGHGPVRCVRKRAEGKRPGERILHENYPDIWLYDWQEASKIAKRDGWGGNDPVQADFDRLLRWLRSDWCYVGVCVEIIDADGDALTEKYDHALWGIESDCEDYIGEVARELAEQAGKAYAEEAQRVAAVNQAHIDMRANAARWAKLCAIIRHKPLGTEVEADGKLRSPTYTRWFFDCDDMTATSIQAALDSIQEPE